MPAAERSEVLRKLQICRALIISVLKAKLEFWDHIPWKLLGAFCNEHGGDLKTAKRIMAECMAEFDEAIRLGRPVHRVAERILAKGTQCRGELDFWLASDKP